MSEQKAHADSRRWYRKPVLRRRRRLAEVVEGNASNIIVTGAVIT